MRIDEIINTDYKDTDFKKSRDLEIGRGRYSAVTQPNEYSVDKQYRKKYPDIFQDPYYIYIKTISDNNLASENPYFPRVYSVESGNIQGHQRPKFNIEKLQPLSNMSEEIIYSLGNKVFKYWDQAFNFNKEHGQDVSAGFTSAMNRALHSGRYDDLKDPQLISAIETLAAIRKNHPNCKPDIHPGNVMVRLTSSGPQLVLTDPLH